jgi:hypothetical protein
MAGRILRRGTGVRITGNGGQRGVGHGCRARGEAARLWDGVRRNHPDGCHKRGRQPDASRLSLRAGQPRIGRLAHVVRTTRRGRVVRHGHGALEHRPGSVSGSPGVGSRRRGCVPGHRASSRQAILHRREGPTHRSPRDPLRDPGSHPVRNGTGGGDPVPGGAVGDVSAPALPPRFRGHGCAMFGLWHVLPTIDRLGRNPVGRRVSGSFRSWQRLLVGLCL